MIDKRIAEAAKQRGINYLVHFTNVENLPNIAAHGLMTRDNLDEKSFDYEYNDYQRIDGLKNSISLTFTFPNYRMFWRYRQSFENYAVILLDAYKILSELPCAFHATNAANNSERHRKLAERTTFDSFNKMFYNPSDGRANRNLDDNEPTDPQAEVLCLADIPLKYFSKIVFEYGNLAEENQKLFPNVPCVVDRDYFAPRHDWAHWKTVRSDLEDWE